MHPRSAQKVCRRRINSWKVSGLDLAGVTGGFGVLNKSPHPNAAKLFLGWFGSKGFKLWDEINPPRGLPFGGTWLEKETKGKTWSYSPSIKQLPNPQEFERQLVKALGVSK